MATTIAKLNIHLGAQTTALEQGMQRAQGSVSRFAGLASKALGLLGGVSALGFGVKLAADAEQAQVAFSTLLGSAEEAKAVLGEITEFAAATPFGTSELRDAGRMLAAFGIQGQAIVPLLRQLGDLAAGTNQPIGELAEIFGKAKVQGRLFMEDINQLTGRGIPIIGALAKQFGVAEVAVRELVETGQVNFSHLEKALQSMTAKGAQFGGLMEAQSKTLAGVWSSLKDNVALLAQAMGTALLPAIKAVAEGALQLTNFISGLDASTVKTTVQIGAFAVAFGAVLALVPKIVAGIRAIIAAYRALSAAKLFALAASGPQGIALAAASLAAASAAAYGAGLAFDHFAGDLDKTQAAANAAAGAIDQAGAAADAASKKLDVEGVKVTTTDAGGGIRVKINATDMQAAGEALDALDAKMADVFAARNLAAPQAEHFAKSAAEFQKQMTDLKAAADRVTASVADTLVKPGEKFADTMSELNNLLSLGLITMETFGAAAEKAHEELESAALEMAEAAGSAQELESVRTPGVGAATRGTAEGFSAVEAARRAQSDAAENQRRHKEHLAKLDEIRKELHDQAKDRVRVNQVKL